MPLCDITRDLFHKPLVEQTNWKIKKSNLVVIKEVKLKIIFPAGFFLIFSPRLLTDRLEMLIVVGRRWVDWGDFA